MSRPIHLASLLLLVLIAACSEDPARGRGGGGGGGGGGATDTGLLDTAIGSGDTGSDGDTVSTDTGADSDGSSDTTVDDTTDTTVDDTTDTTVDDTTDTTVEDTTDTTVDDTTDTTVDDTTDTTVDDTTDTTVDDTTDTTVDDTTPPLPLCGNGLAEAGEACDDGNLDNTDSCSNFCTVARCGDGFVHAGFEGCDDANGSNTDGCLTTCVPAACGDGLVFTGVEACDDANTSNTDSCTNGCTLPRCGDGYAQPGETCDDGNTSNTDTCTNTCLAATCGDGFAQPGEACDDGNSSNTDSCTNGCTAPRCGDGFAQPGEACDDGNSSNTDSCTNACAAPRCGDGFVRAGVEPCDDGNTFNTDACTNSCIAATCGDGFVRSGVEVCDDANSANTDSCTNACLAATCGDGFVQPGEACDDTNNANTDSCTNACLAAACGDGFLQAGEACDDGNAAAGDGCLNCAIEGGLCTTGTDLNFGTTSSLNYTTTTTIASGNSGEPSCLVGTTGRGGNDLIFAWSPTVSGSYDISTAGSSFDTLLEVFSGCSGATSLACNDDITTTTNLDSAVTVNLVAGTTYRIWVDGYATATGTVVLAAALVPPPGSRCGDGIIYGTEQCDDGNTTSGDGCSATCRSEFCGDGVVQAARGESCDDGNTTSGDGCSATCVSEAVTCATDLTLGTVTSVGSLPLSIETATATRDPSCGGTGGRNGRDVSVFWVAPTAGSYQFDTVGSTRDTIISFFRGCQLSGTELTTQCNDDISGSVGGPSSLTLNAAAGEPFTIWVDSYGTATTGTAVLNISKNLAPTCADTGDLDADRLPNCYETGTGIYVSGTNTGTSPSNNDTDGDGIKDGDEVLGSRGGLNLPALGASPVRKDIFVEVDWYDDSLDCAAHSHRITPAAASLATAMFANAAVTNPDRSSGIRLHIDYGQGAPYTAGTLLTSADARITGGLDAEFLTEKAANFAIQREGYFHYAISAHDFTDRSAGGLGEIGGDDFVVAAACAATDFNLAAILNHELGHNLGLEHGGDTACNNKPNYASIMNYTFSYTGVDDTCDAVGDGTLDYSYGLNPDLIESALSEAAGVCGSPGIDWNANTRIDTVAFSQNLNVYTEEATDCGGTLTTLTDHDDWGSLALGAMNDADLGGSRPPVVSCSF